MLLRNVGTHLPNYTVPIFTAVKISNLMSQFLFPTISHMFLIRSSLIKRTYPKMRGMNSKTGYSVRDFMSCAG